MSNFASSVIGALIGGGLAIAAGLVHKIYADCVEGRRLRRALAAEIRAILDMIEQDKLVTKIEDMVIHRCQKSSMPSWPDHLPSGNQKRFWRDPVKRAGICCHWQPNGNGGSLT
jgi:hypothetical protein